MCRAIRRRLAKLEDDSIDAWENNDPAGAEMIDLEIHVLAVFLRALECHLNDPGYLARNKIKLAIREEVFRIFSRNIQMSLLCLTTETCAI